MTDGYPYPDFVHFHSYESRLSLELPAGWEEEDESENQVIYVNRDDSETPIEPRLIVRVQAVPADSDAWRQLADGQRDRPGRDLIDSREIAIDGVPARLDITGYDEPGLGGKVLHVQAFAQISDVLFSVSGVAAWKERAMWTPVFTDAVDSIRFILV